MGTLMNMLMVRQNNSAILEKQSFLTKLNAHSLCGPQAHYYLPERNMNKNPAALLITPQSGQQARYSSTGKLIIHK